MISTFSSIGAVAPPIILMVIGMVILLWDLFTPNKRTLYAIGLLGCVVAAIAAIGSLTGNRAGVTAFGGGMISDDFGNLFCIVLCVIAGLSITMSDRYLQERALPEGEYVALILFSTSGAMVMAMANDLVNVFVGLEILSVALYILSGLARRERKSEEAAVKYFLLGAFASGL